MTPGVKSPVQLQLLPGGKPATRARGPKPTSSTTPPAWAAYRPAHPVKCHDCLIECGRNPAAPAAMLAKRRYRGKGLDLLLCYTHAAARGDTQLRRRHRAAG